MKHPSRAQIIAGFAAIYTGDRRPAIRFAVRDSAVPDGGNASSRGRRDPVPVCPAKGRAEAERRSLESLRADRSAVAARRQRPGVLGGKTRGVGAGRVDRRLGSALDGRALGFRRAPASGLPRTRRPRPGRHRASRPSVGDRLRTRSPRWRGCAARRGPCWSLGSSGAGVVSLPSPTLVATGMEALAGRSGARLQFAGGERVQASAITLRSMVSLGYPIVAGSVIGFSSAYVWLLKVASPERVSTYAFVNPIVAVALGLAFGGESLTLRIALSAAVIVGAVALILRFGKSRAPGSAAELSVRRTSAAVELVRTPSVAGPAPGQRRPGASPRLAGPGHGTRPLFRFAASRRTLLRPRRERQKGSRPGPPARRGRPPAAH